MHPTDSNTSTTPDGPPPQCLTLGFVDLPGHPFYGRQVRLLQRQRRGNIISCGNLLSNAVRYTPSGGQVQIASGSSATEAWVAVSDTGIGMTPDVLARVFEVFYRGPEARTLEATGLGLGLALVQQMVQAHD